MKKKSLFILIAITAVLLFCLSACDKEQPTTDEVKYTNVYDFTLSKRGDHFAITSYTGKETTVVVPVSFSGTPITVIGDSAFYNTSINTLIISEGIKTFEDYALGKMELLENVKLPKSLTGIGNCAFSGDMNLRNIEIDEGNEYFTVKDGCLYSKDLKRFIAYPHGSPLLEYSVMDGVEEIGGDVFINNTALTKMTIPASVKKISTTAFYNTNIEEFIVDDGNETFASADGALYMKDKKSLVLYPKNRKTVSLTEECETLLERSFLCSEIRFFVIPDGIKKISRLAFEASYITALTIPDSVETIEDETFYKAGLLNKFVLNGNHEHFYTDGRALFTIDGERLVAYCIGNTDYVYRVPDGVKEMGTASVYMADHLKKITFPSSLEKLNDAALRGSDVVVVEFLGNTPCEMLSTSIELRNNNITFFVPDAVVDTYKSATGWEIYTELINPISESPSIDLLL